MFVYSCCRHFSATNSEETRQA